MSVVEGVNTGPGPLLELSLGVCEQQYYMPQAKEVSEPGIITGESPEQWRKPWYMVLRFPSLWVVLARLARSA